MHAGISRHITNLAADIRYRGLNVPILEVEEHLLNLPHISEAYVVPVLNVFGGGQQVAAVIRLRKKSASANLNEDSTTALKLSLHALRLDLSVHLAEFKLPTLLRILADDEDIPRSQAGKTMPKEIVPRFFPQPVEGSLDGLPENVQQCSTTIRKGPVAWDRGALRC
jgi:malonyl-CoA/methylmalonyl-CoA synthetase